MINQSPPSRSRGRPRAFDRDEALARAGEAFWRMGYEGTSITDLTAAMGITPQSLYAAFGSKAELYREALTQYRATIGASTACALAEEPTAVAAFNRMLRESALEFCRDDRPRGCMISTAVLTCATENDVIAAHVAALRADTLASFRARVERGMKEGDLTGDTDAVGLARYLGAIVQGMSVQARDGASEAELAAIATIAAAEVARHQALPRSVRARRRQR